jgi:hypothetical protein
MNDGSNKLLDVFARHKTLSATAAATLLKTLPQDAKNRMAVALISEYKRKIVESLNQLAEQQGVPIKTLDTSASRAENLKIAVSLDRIDYAALILALYPRVKDNPALKARLGKIAPMLEKFQDYGTDMIQAVIQSMPQAAWDDFIATLVQVYEPEICGVVNEQFAKHELPLTISTVAAITV